MEKQKISFEQAAVMLDKKLETLNVGDHVYGMVNDIFHNAVNEIEEKYTVVDDDGEAIEPALGEAWYDEVDEDFRQDCYDKIKKFL